MRYFILNEQLVCNVTLLHAINGISKPMIGCEKINIIIRLFLYVR